MRMIVPINATGGPVIARIVIDGIVTWGYTYAAEQHTFHQQGNHNGPNDHALGVPDELHMDVHSWRIAVFNVSDAPKKYAIQITWLQDGAVRAVWPADGPRTGTVNPNEGQVEEDRAILAVI
jgi:hypothetical protein